jgi:hypothetical protein
MVWHLVKHRDKFTSYLYKLPARRRCESLRFMLFLDDNNISLATRESRRHSLIPRENNILNLNTVPSSLKISKMTAIRNNVSLFPVIRNLVSVETN